MLFVGLIIFASSSLRLLDYNVENEVKETKELESDLIIVGFSQLGSESDWRTANTKSIQNALTKQNGFSLIFSNGRQSQENQIKDVRSFIFQEVDYIVIAPVTETGWDTVLEEARQANIPVIIVDRMIDTEDESLYVACVGTDKYMEGQKAGLWLEQYLKERKEESFDQKEYASNADLLEQAKDYEKEQDKKLDVEQEKGQGIDQDKGQDIEQGHDKDQDTMQEKDKETNQKAEHNKDGINIVILEGTPDSTAQIGRSKGFEDIAAVHDDWNILAKENGDFTKAKGKEVMKRYLQEFEDIDVLVSQNDDMTFGAIEAITEAGLTCGVNGDIIVISFDAVSEAFDKMEEGLINVDIECNPLQGELIADIIRSLEHGEEIDKLSYVDGKVFEAKNASKDRIGRTY